MKQLSRPALLRYLRHLPPKMLAGKAKHLVVQRLLAARAVGSGSPGGFDWGKAFGNPHLKAFAGVFRVHGDRFARTCQSVHDGELNSDGICLSFGSAENVQWSGESEVESKYARWRFDLAFFYFAIALTQETPERGVKTIASMTRSLDSQLEQDASQLRGIQWSPLVVATRALSLATSVALLPDNVKRDNYADLADIGGHIWRCTELLRLLVERYLGYNHAAITESGLAIGLLLQGHSAEAERSLLNAVSTLESGTLTDGMWAERSPTYHLYMMVLVDALRSLSGPPGSDRFDRLDVLHRRMQSALAAVVHPDGQIAVFNDAQIGDGPSPCAVGWSNEQTPASIVLGESGYARLARGGTVVIMDAGPMGPDAVIGHGHADFLSIEVSVAHKRLIVDPGVASVSAGADREWTRSAASHNGPTIAGCEPAEFFGAWRVGRRGKAWFCYSSSDQQGALSVEGECDGYRPWGVTVRRKVVVEPDGTLTISDMWISDLPPHRPQVTFSVPGDWIAGERDTSTIDFIHQDGTRVRFTLLAGKLAEVAESRIFREGPAHQETATRFTAIPEDQIVTIRLEMIEKKD